MMPIREDEPGEKKTTAKTFLHFGFSDHFEAILRAYIVIVSLFEIHFFFSVFAKHFQQLNLRSAMRRYVHGSWIMVCLLCGYSVFSIHIT